ncbi:diacylglycerol kinase [Crocosphaera subtropica ATCC 51142]|uniref:Diacylglycerol kinase n=1 Tax=Crocosphaera subtropica (strain ATCC 51142 / BH68) TaxID=43989 RepID=B1WV39_CROS5|nr:diacylglycerol kinase family protein [Crocosphaera subtropica]ACB52236.1 diacylglycerol kinase [Crocosphaera subtropica ATCC 51142]
MKADFKMSQSAATTFFSGATALRQPHIPHYPREESPSDIRKNSAWHIAPNLFVSFKYAWAGISYAFITQRNFRIHTAMTATAISFGLFLHVNALGMAIVALTCALVMVLELLNTALESVVDLTVGQSYHELAKIAKDCAAGAVMISALAAVLVAGFIIAPPLLAMVFPL